jgi:16S rRNA (guanine(527)-N(7))-methyltransferase RsmG
MVQDSLRHLLEKGGGEIHEDAVERIRLHHELLLTWNPTAHLVSSGDARLDALTRHDLEAAQALPHLGIHRDLVDVGSGGGYPGLIWACCRPDLSVTLVEANLRKATFLREACRHLDLPHVRVEHQRCATVNQLIALGGDLWTSRAAGCSQLLFTAGDEPEAGSPTIILYAGAQQADRLAEGGYAGWTCRVDEPLVSGAAGRLQVLTRV